MKFLSLILMLFTLCTAHANPASIEAYFSANKEVGVHQSRLFLQNICYTDLYVGIRHMNGSGDYESKGYWRVFPGQVIYLTDLKGSFYYLHAFTSDHRVYWDGEHKIEINNKQVPAALVKIGEHGGEWTTVLYCR